MSVSLAIEKDLASRLGLTVSGFERLGVTAYNRHYRVELDDGPGVTAGPVHLVVYTLPDSLPLQGLRFEHAIVRYLLKSGFRAAPGLHVKEGESLFRVGDYHYALTEWIEGCHSEQDLAISDAQVVDSARVLADLHRATQGFTEVLDYFPEHVFVYPASQVFEVGDALFEELEARVATGAFDDDARAQHARFAPRARAFLEGFDRELYAEVRRADPTTVVHGDYRRMNLVYGAEGGVHRVLDYNCCFNEIRLWDLAYSALSFGGKETVAPLRDSERAATFIRGYDAASPLSGAEWRLLPSFLTFCVVKLMLAAVKSWWITERAETFERLLDGEAARIAALAATDPTGRET